MKRMSKLILGWAVFAAVSVAIVAANSLPMILGATTTNMSLTIPDVGVTSGPDYATQINQAFTDIDAHDHTSGNGVQVPVAGLDIDANLDLSPGATDYGINNADYYDFATNASAPTNGSLWMDASGELYYTDTSANDVQITSGGAISASTIGGIGGDYTGTDAVVNYSNTTKSYTFYQDDSPAQTGNIVAGTVAISEPGVTSAKTISLKSPTSLAANYAWTWPAANPTVASALAFDTSGQMLYRSLPSVTIGDGTNSFGDYEGTNQTPFTSAITALSSGGVIYVGQGTYTFTAAVDISTAGITLVGAGVGETVITGDIDDTIIEISAARVTLQGMEVINTADGTRVATVKLTSGGDDARILHNKIHYNNTTTTGTGAALWMEDTTRTFVGSNHIVTEAAGTSQTRFGICLGTQPSSTTVGDADGNKVIGNHVEINDNSSTTGTGAAIGMYNDGGSATSSSTDWNVIANNYVDPDGAVTDGIGCTAVTTGGGQIANCRYNMVTGNVFFSAARSRELHVDENNGGGTCQAQENTFFGNNITNGGVFTASNGATTTENSISLSGNYYCNDGTCAAGTQIVDADFQQK